VIESENTTIGFKPRRYARPLMRGSGGIPFGILACRRILDLNLNETQITLELLLIACATMLMIAGRMLLGIFGCLSGIRLCLKTRSGFERLIFRLAASGSIDDKTNIACFAVFARRKNARSRTRRRSFQTEPRKVN